MNTPTSEIKYSNFVNCDHCNYEMLRDEKKCHGEELICCYCDDEEKLISQYSEEQQSDLRKYSEEHSLSIEEAIDYQTHCHSCGKTVEDNLFDGVNHQYCRKKCFEYCEDYWYPCYRGADCLVCGIWQYHLDREEKQKRVIELQKVEPVLAAINCFQEMKIHEQLFECIGNLVEYF
jgi:hypothetical protein